MTLFVSFVARSVDLRICLNASSFLKSSSSICPQIPWLIITKGLLVMSHDLSLVSSLLLVSSAWNLFSLSIFFIQGCVWIISNPYWLNSFWLVWVQGGHEGYFYLLMTPSVWTIHRKGALSCQGWGLSLLSLSCCVNDIHIWAHFKWVYFICAIDYAMGSFWVMAPT